MPASDDRLIAKLDELSRQFDEVEAQLADPAAMSDHERVRELSVRRAAISGLVERYRQWRRLQNQVRDNEALITSADDPEIKELAEAELPDLRQRAAGLLDEASNELVTAEDRSIGSVILELRAGTGGAEAALFAGELLEAYQRYAGGRGWKLDLMEVAPGEAGGIRHAIAGVKGEAVWQGLGYESGVHCVKRVPATETQGRVHTSTATVAVLPEPEKVDIDIPDSDVKMDITTAQGPGGQNVNKVATAVKMVHIPTGIEVRMQESKSQQQNRERAWALLRARVYDHYQRQKDAERREQRSAMIGTGGRSERVRTYRWKENIVVDHRLEQRTFNLGAVMAGDLDELVEALIAEDRTQRLAAL
jgi:peptide chain release factor 1